MRLFKRANCVNCGKEFPQVWSGGSYCSYGCAKGSKPRFGPPGPPPPAPTLPRPLERPEQPDADIWVYSGYKAPSKAPRTRQPSLANPTKVRRAGTLGELLTLVPDSEDVVNQAYLLGYEKGKDQRPARSKEENLELQYARVALLQLTRAARRLGDDAQDQLFMELAAAEDALARTDRSGDNSGPTRRVPTDSAGVYSPGSSDGPDEANF